MGFSRERVRQVEHAGLRALPDVDIRARLEAWQRTGDQEGSVHAFSWTPPSRKYVTIVPLPLTWIGPRCSNR
jgi:hypothetical protein